MVSFSKILIAFPRDDKKNEIGIGRYFIPTLSKP